MAKRDSEARVSLARRAVAEATGTALLLAAVVGSGIMGERQRRRRAAGEHACDGRGPRRADTHLRPRLRRAFQPGRVGSLRLAARLAWREVPVYLAAQFAGALAGVAAAHLMFGEPLFTASRHARAGGAQLFGEFVATFGLLSVVWGCARTRAPAVPFAVGAYITAAYWFTSSTSFANPAVTVARSLTDTFSGIRPSDAPGFVAAQLTGAAAATALFRWLIPTLPRDAPEVVVPHGDDEGGANH